MPEELRIVHGRVVRIKTPEKPKSGRKRLPSGDKREMYSTRLHPNTIEAIKKIRTVQGKPASRIVENLILKESNRLGL